MGEPSAVMTTEGAPEGPGFRGVTDRIGRGAEAVFVPLAAVALALLMAASLLWLADIPPVDAYRALLRGAVGSDVNLSITLARATPLILVGLGVAFAMRANFINVGGEGQLYFGALAGTWAAIQFGGLSGAVGIPVALLVAMAAGAAWALIPGLLKAYRGTNEVITTILLNYVAVGIVSYFVYGPFKDPNSLQFPQSAEVPPSTQLPDLGPVHLGFWLAIAAAVFLGVLLSRTAIGYEMKVISSSAGAAFYAAIPVRRRLILSVAVAGALAGLGGAVEILGVQLRLLPDFMPGVAFTAIVVALLGQNKPLGVVVAGLFIGALFNGSEAMQRSTATPSVIVYAVEALVVIFLLVGLNLRSGKRGPLRILLSTVSSPFSRKGPRRDPSYRADRVDTLT